MTEVKSYKCPCCGAPLRYDPSGKLACDACDNAYEVELIEELSKEPAGDTSFDWSNYKQDVKAGESIQDTVVYSCRSCGAAIETERTTAATHCPYCDNEIILNDRLSGGLRPNGVIPFKVHSDDIVARVDEFAHGKKLLPNDFFDKRKLSGIQGVYVPFWFFGAGLDGDASFEGTRVSTFADRDYIYTVTRHYLAQLSGSMAFTNIPVDASARLDNDLMDSLEPFDYSAVTDFRSEYLSGYFADRFDEDPDASIPRAESRMRNSARYLFRSSISGRYATVTERSDDLRIHDPAVKYILLPVYLINAEYEGVNYRYAINGQTGKMIGELPISKSKKIRMFLATFFICFIIFLILIFFVYAEGEGLL